MFKFLKNIFSKRKKGEPLINKETPAKAEYESSYTEASKTASVKSEFSQSLGNNNKEQLLISLSSIIETLSENLKHFVINKPDNTVTVRIPIETILPQISTGTVKISFGDLKKISPAGIFLTNTRCDNEPVTLPLKEIISKLDISHFELNPREEVIIPDDIPSLFTSKGVTSNVKPVEPLISKEKKRFQKAETQPVLEKPTSVSEQKVETKPIPFKQTVVSETKCISLKLREIVPYCKDEVANEIESLKLTDTTLNLPIEELTARMSTGRVTFNWNKIQEWLLPRPTSTLSNQDIEIEIPLKVLVPLYLPHIKKAHKKIITVPNDIPNIFTPEQPSLLKQTVLVSPEPIERPTEPVKPVAEKKPSEFEEIKPEKAIPPVAKLSGVKSLSELFNKPDKKIWTPNEIIESVVTLPGVSGAMIALKEGLPVVSKLPKDLDPEMFAGMLTQIFSRLSQYANDLNLKNLHGFTLYCEGKPVFVCERENIYFIVTGNENEDLPSSLQLQAIVDELVKMNKK
ncbi:MAG: roadblock/LC7 domain-containing protein [Verrucomicrobiia bacterium]